jgi:endonuclease/exonuclease/phosphatase family metal-dependent hydrolase
MATFRLATINVHSFHNRIEHRENINDLVAILNPLDLDLIAVQEVVNDENWLHFCKLLSLYLVQVMKIILVMV